jgi:hypothetical protein
MYVHVHTFLRAQVQSHSTSLEAQCQGLVHSSCRDELFLSERVCNMTYGAGEPALLYAILYVSVPNGAITNACAFRDLDS